MILILLNCKGLELGGGRGFAQVLMTFLITRLLVRSFV